MPDAPKNPLDREQHSLGQSFYRGDAVEQRERLQLQLEEKTARAQIAEATGIRDDQLLAELAGLGIRVDTLAALTLIPLISVAWADGEMDERERESVLAGAVSSGIERDSTSYRLLQIWLREEPPPDLTFAWHEFTKALCGTLAPGQIEHLQANILGRARDVAAAAGDSLDRTPHVSEEEVAKLAELESAFG